MCNNYRKQDFSWGGGKSGREGGADKKNTNKYFDRDN